MRSSNTIVAGTFSGGEIENGTFHALATPSKSGRVNQRVLDAAGQHAHAQNGSAPAASVARLWVPEPESEEVLPLQQ